MFSQLGYKNSVKNLIVLLIVFAVSFFTIILQCWVAVMANEVIAVSTVAEFALLIPMTYLSVKIALGAGKKLISVKI
ncbi:MAG: hypothetical protein K0R29_2769 [Pseudobdellovibrio sp.]|jgi:hypothetical protein|nr:hypothetical protein [Pseudobdellovibrio sp.]